MKIKKYVLSRKAQIHLLEIRDYTIENFGVSQWNKYKQILTKGFETTVDNPKIGKDCEDVQPNALRYKVGYHNIYYSIKESEILIIALLTDHQMPENHL
ncbi:type II toxin-antitoxin system RelE/ParE family toxin [Vibrio cholerae]|nr:type II toxin-antitoxin system RelE/ParE family toxin [Vibrio cholerae]